MKIVKSGVYKVKLLSYTVTKGRTTWKFKKKGK
jgi:hypothetical protein